MLDMNATDGKPFSELDGGTYNNALVLNGGASQNYGIASIPGKLVVSPADFSDTDRFMVDVKDATYNAEAQVAQVVVVDRAFDPARTLEQDTQFKVVYLGNHTDAGTAYVSKFSGLSDDIQRITNMINEHVEDLNEMAQTYITTEAQIEEMTQSLSADVIV